MADTYTPILNLILQETGGNNNSWGTNLNNEVITPLENAVKGCLTISSLTGGAYTLTQANAVYGTIILSGTLSSDLTITVPATANNWRFINNLTHAGYYVIIKVSGQTGCNIPHGKITEISCDGTNMYRHDRENVGELFYHAGSSVPGGAIECTGATPLRLSAIDLFAEIGTTWGTGNGSTTFTIPDAYTAGKFLRSRTGSVAIATSQSDQNKAHTHSISGVPGVGTLAVDSGGSHTHTFTGTAGTYTVYPGGSSSNYSPYSAGDSWSGFAYGSGGGGGFYAAVDGLQSIDGTNSFSGTNTPAGSNSTSGAHTHTVSGALTAGTLATVTDGGTEARPTNLSAILCIRY